MLVGLLNLFFAISSTASTNPKIVCSFSYYSAPFASVSFSKTSNGYDTVAEIERYGQTTYESLDEEQTLNNDQLLRFFLSKGTSNQIEMIIYQPDSKNVFNAVLINHQAPMQKEMYGTCEGL